MLLNVLLRKRTYCWACFCPWEVVGKVAGHEGYKWTWALVCLPCKPNQEPENKRPKIEQRTAILSMSRVARVKIIQWENIIKGLSTPYPYLTPFKSKQNNGERKALDFPQRSQYYQEGVEQNTQLTQAYSTAGKVGIVSSQAESWRKVGGPESEHNYKGKHSAI